MPSDRARQEWRNRVAAEYRSASITAQTLHWAIVVALPEPILKTAIRIVGDEIDHATLSHEVLVEIGGGDEPVALNPHHLSLPEASEGPLPALVDAVVDNFCLGETFAVPLFARMREGTTLPVARAALDRILRDEAVHRAFGWDTLDEIIALAPDPVRARIQARLPGWLSSFAQGYGTLRPQEPLSDDERGAGLIRLDEYVEIWHRTVRDDLSQRFARRGIAIPEFPGSGIYAP
jgi:1,2-phenylacetyl-CoA epoxidase catalytic subunit